MSQARIDAVSVGLDFGEGVATVGRLASRDRQIYFEYDPAFLEKGLEISPLHLPLMPGLQVCEARPFEGLPGVFNDSLPDGWGRLLFDRSLRAEGVSPQEVGPLDRLAAVGARGMGALVYEPDRAPVLAPTLIDLDQLAVDAAEVLAGQAEDVVRDLIALNGSSAGARPKALVLFDPGTGEMRYGEADAASGLESWLVKFPNTQDGPDAGVIEYVYSLMARASGVAMTPTRLIAAEQGAFFATRRFDREGTRRLHVHTASGLLQVDHRVPSLDYETLLTLAARLTRDIRQAEEMFRQAVFNVLAHNRDDHAKNFSFLMDADGRWRLSPAYDLTFSSGPGGEQSTTVMGEGRAPGVEHLKRLGASSGLTKGAVEDIIAQTSRAIGQWRDLADEHGVSPANVRLIEARIRRL